MLLDHILKRLSDLEHQVYDLQMRNDYLEQKLAEHKSVEIGKIVYKIQELAIETMSGILNVGISATNSGDQEQWIEELVKEKKIEWEVDQMKEASQNESN
ncbi:spore germination protein GerPC [Risungbinella massiliensis]|uniref:spore germination protein GerPC n=1 Tax=Risungbinella massiliensis TaxID=1329796 RepID=UPI001C9BCC72|nr:spore germination protein GerPC [Risungbinella massiliensis]